MTSGHDSTGSSATSDTTRCSFVLSAATDSRAGSGWCRQNDGRSRLLPRPRPGQSSSRLGDAPIGIFFRAVADRRIGLTSVTDHRFAWTPRLVKSNLPLIVLISYDFGESRDPAEWRCATSAIAWSRTSVVHATGAQVEHYPTALIAAEITGRSLFIETDSDHAPAWGAAIQPREVLCLLLRPPNGGVHPAAANVVINRPQGEKKAPKSRDTAG
jgi:hypothetical protein